MKCASQNCLTLPGGRRRSDVTRVARRSRHCFAKALADSGRDAALGSHSVPSSGGAHTQEKGIRGALGGVRMDIKGEDYPPGKDLSFPSFTPTLLHGP